MMLAHLKKGHSPPSEGSKPAPNLDGISSKMILSVIDFRLGFFNQVTSLFESLDRLDPIDRQAAILDLPESIAFIYESYLVDEWSYSREVLKFLYLKKHLLDLVPSKVYSVINDPAFSSWTMGQFKEALGD